MRPEGKRSEGTGGPGAGGAKGPGAGGKGQAGGGKGQGGVPGELRYGLYFLAIVLLLYVGVLALDGDGARRALEASWDVLVQVAPVLVLVLLTMGVMNLLVSPRSIRRHVGEGSGAKGWAIAIATGILSHGPIYVWFPLLKELRDQGMRSGLVVAFLYNRGVKVPLLPVMVFYFGLEYVGVLVVLMMAASVVQGVLFEATEARGA